MTEFNDRTRAEAEVVVTRHLAEVESARRVIAAIDGDADYVALTAQIKALENEVQAEVEKGDAVLRQLLDAEKRCGQLAREVENEQHRHTLTREFNATTVETLRETNVELREALADARKRLEGADRRIGRHQAEIERLKSELADRIVQLESAGKVPEGGARKSPRVLDLSVNARAVRDAVDGMRPDGSKSGAKISFTAADVQAWILAHDPRVVALSLPRIRKALGELEGIRVKKIVTPHREAARWVKLTPIRPARRRKQ